MKVCVFNYLQQSGPSYPPKRIFKSCRLRLSWQWFEGRLYYFWPAVLRSLYEHEGETKARPGWTKTEREREFWPGCKGTASHRRLLVPLAQLEFSLKHRKTQLILSDPSNPYRPHEWLDEHSFLSCVGIFPKNRESLGEIYQRVHSFFWWSVEFSYVIALKWCYCWR